MRPSFHGKKRDVPPSALSSGSCALRRMEALKAARAAMPAPPARSVFQKLPSLLITKYVSRPADPKNCRLPIFDYRLDTQCIGQSAIGNRQSAMFHFLDEREIKLLLMDSRITRYIN